MFKVNNKDTRVTSLTSFWCLYCYLWTCFTPFSSVFTVNCEQVNVCCRNQLLKKSYFCFLCFLFFFCRNQLLEKFSFFFFFFFFTFEFFPCLAIFVKRDVIGVYSLYLWLVQYHKVFLNMFMALVNVFVIPFMKVRNVLIKSWDTMKKH